jgi:hypothetical protein
MFKVTTAKASEILGLPVGYVVYNDEKSAELRAKYRKAIEAEDNARFEEAVKACPKGCWVVTKSWQENGNTLRRGTIVRVKQQALGGCIVKVHGGADVFCTCGWGELKAHAVQCNGVRILYATAYNEDDSIISRVDRPVYYGSVRDAAFELLDEMDGHDVYSICVEEYAYGRFAHLASRYGMDWDTFGINKKEN